jgi:hypothetical protein
MSTGDDSPALAPTKDQEMFALFTYGHFGFIRTRVAEMEAGVGLVIVSFIGPGSPVVLPRYFRLH